MEKQKRPTKKKSHEKQENKRVKGNKKAKEGTKRDERLEGPWKIKKTDIAIFFLHQIVNFILHVLYLHLHPNLYL